MYRGFFYKKYFVIGIFFLLLGFLDSGYLAQTKKKSIINLFCIESFKDEMLKAKIIHNDEFAKDTCDCYLEHFLNNNSHQKAINKCKLEAKKKFNL